MLASVFLQRKWGIPTRLRLCLFVGALLAVAALMIWVILSIVRPPAHRPTIAEARLEKTTNVLLIGTDAPTTGAGQDVRTDVLMLAACDLGRNRVTILSIPRDTLVEIPGHGQERINMANLYGGLPLTIQIVERLTGLRVDRYLAVDFRAFEELVDLMGGVEVEVDKRMYYSDKSQGLLIDLRKGPQLLNGHQALGYVRYRRDPLGDISRVQRQQRLLRVVFDKAAKERIWTKFVALYRLKRRYVRTNLGLIDMYRLRNFGRQLAGGTGLCAFTVPGWFSGPYWAADKKTLAALIEREFKPVKVAVAEKGKK